MISNVAIYNAPILPVAPLVSRNQQGQVQIVSPDKSAAIYYTTDGSEPSEKTIKYEGPFLKDGNVTIKAVLAGSSNTKGEVAQKVFSFSKTSWKIVGEANETPALLDGDQGASWFGKEGEKELVIDFGKRLSFSGISILPDQSRHPKGIPLDYAVSVSNDGKIWEKVANGEFANIVNSPTLREINFPRQVNGRFLKFETTSVADNQNQLGIAVLEVTE
jgi:alpha-L-fucosidase